MDLKPIDADNHYYESLDAFTRHLDPKFNDRGASGRCRTASASQLLIGGKVNRFVPNPTFDPIIVPGCLDPLFRGQIPEGVDPRTLMQVEPLRAEYRDRDERLQVMDEQGLGAALLFPTLGLRRRGGAARRHPGDDGEPVRLQPVARGGLGLRLPGPAHRRADAVARRPGRRRRRGRLAASSAARASCTSAPRRSPVRTAPAARSATSCHDPVWARLAEASIPVAFHLGDSGYQRRFAGAWGAKAEFGFGNSDPLAPGAGVRPADPRHHRVAGRPRRVQPPPDAARRQHRERLGLAAACWSSTCASRPTRRRGSSPRTRSTRCGATSGSRPTSRRTSRRWPS